VEFTIAEAKKDNKVIEGKTLLVRKEPIENRKASYSLIKTSIYSQQNASNIEDISMNCWDSLSRNEHISGRKLEYPEKISGMKRS
jgi:hypothetical protein